MELQFRSCPRTSCTGGFPCAVFGIFRWCLDDCLFLNAVSIVSFVFGAATVLSF